MSHKSYRLASRVCKKHISQSLDMTLTIDLSSDLSSDYEKLYKSNKYTDVSINVGKEPNNKIFLAHAVVLCTRSTYFERMIGEFQQTVMAFEDVTSETFEI